MPDSMIQSHLILLVEDDDAQAQLIRIAISRSDENIEVIHVTNGEIALEFLRGDQERQNVRRPDLILLDLKIPKMSGHECLVAIKSDQNLRSIPVIVLTTSSNKNDVSTAYGNHANSYLLKPLSFEIFEEMIGQLCCYWLKWNQPPMYKGKQAGVTRKSQLEK